MQKRNVLYVTAVAMALSLFTNCGDENSVMEEPVNKSDVIEDTRLSAMGLSDIELVAIHSDGDSFSPVSKSEVTTRAPFSPIEELSSYSLRFKNEDSFEKCVNGMTDKKDAYLLSKSIKKFYPDFVSIFDLHDEAMEWSDKYLDETQASYDAWKELYGNYLYFPEYMEDYGAYFPISNIVTAAIANVDGKVVVGDKIVEMKDIFTYKDLQEKGKDPYYSLSDNIMTKGASDPCYHHYILASNMRDCNEEYDSGWTERGDRKLRVKVGRQYKILNIRIHVEISFRKHTILGWSNYKGTTDSDFTYRGTTFPFFEEGTSSHDFYINDGFFDGSPGHTVPYCNTGGWILYNCGYITAKTWSISITFSGFSNYIIQKGSTIPSMVFYYH